MRYLTLILAAILFSCKTEVTKTLSDTDALTNQSRPILCPQYPHCLQAYPVVSCTLGAPLGTTLITDNYPVTITATIADGKIVQVGYAVDNIITNVAVNSANVTQSFTITGLTPGTHSVGIWAVSNEGHRNSQGYFIIR